MPSSVIARMSYNEQTRTLGIVFTSGSVYQYLSVPNEVYNAMKASGSKGAYLNQHIKAKYACKQVQ